MEDIAARVQEWIAFYALKIVAAIVVLVVGRWIVRLINKLVARALARRKMDETAAGFVVHLIGAILTTVVIIAALAQLGIQTTSFVAIIGAAGLAIGLALQGSLSNFAAGFLLLVFRPFKKGDYIEGGGTAGIVQEIQIFTTVLNTPDNKRVIVPNSKITGDNIINYSATGTRRVEIIASCSYSDDLDKVRNVLQGILDADNRILAEPATQIAVKEMADSSINFVVRAWVNTSDYWGFFFDTTEAIKKRFDAEGITIPFPQRDVHLYEHKENPA